MEKVGIAQTTYGKNYQVTKYLLKFKKDTSKPVL